MKEAFVKLLQDVVDGLAKEGYREAGGSDVFRIMRLFRHCEDLDGQEVLLAEVKIYLDNYETPQGVIVRYSFHENEMDV